MDIATLFGRNLNRARSRAGLSQEELAIRATLHRTEIGLLERGERLPRIDTVIKVAGALSIPPTELIKGIEWSPGSTTLGEFKLGPEQDPQSD
ncbi:MAG TPA: helix-turn-helix transcriptional regulator [Solirubrobacterales bacterium]|nr:helix-turn-helix transcriptional regulator [Solirubrobacterales bacterium]